MLPANNRPLISIITVVYNAEKLIESTIQSVITQTYDNLEYIIIDGSSTDGTFSVIDKYKGEIDVYISEKDNGIYDAMNKGIKIANGEWVNFMNAGDTFKDSHVLETIFNKKLPEHVHFIYSDFLIKKKHLKSGTLKIKANYKTGTLLHQSVIYKRELHNIYGYYIVTNKLIVADYLFFNSIPVNNTTKTNTIISINNEAGVSQGSWCFYQKKCVDYIYNRISLSRLIRDILLYKCILAARFLLGRKIVKWIEKVKHEINN